MQKLFRVDLRKSNNEIFSILIPAKAKVRIVTKNKIQKAKNLEIGDIILGNSTIEEIVEILTRFPKIKSSKDTCIEVPNIKNLKKELDELFGDNTWDPKNPKATELFKKYYIKEIRKEYLGVKIVNLFEQHVYFSGELLTDVYYSPYNSLNIHLDTGDFPIKKSR